MRRYLRIAFLVILIAGLSVTSTAASFLRAVDEQPDVLWCDPHTPIEEIPYWNITRHGFPFPWYFEDRCVVGGQVTAVYYRFNSILFISDTLIYVILYSVVVAIILWTHGIIIWTYKKYREKHIKVGNRISE